MPKKGHTEEQIAALKQHESGEKTADIYRRLAISQATFWSTRACTTTRYLCTGQDIRRAANDRIKIQAKRKPDFHS